MDTLTQEKLRSFLHYDPTTGVFTHLTKTSRREAGDEAGTLNKRGYRVICIEAEAYYAHRLAFLYMVGRFPNEVADHINGIKDDNRWCNLREATQSQNIINQPLRKDNKTGYKCVRPRGKRFTAQITVNKKRIPLGIYDTAEEAGRVAQAARLHYYGEFATPRTTTKEAE
ncbi:HNH endonuclease [Paraburkholderia sp. BR10882]|uniref:HNH endonuclease n=1 Tax=unclassified Paraburkholderia TaxID=2615204 RepID=UPI0034CD57D4